MVKCGGSSKGLEWLQLKLLKKKKQLFTELEIKSFLENVQNRKWSSMEK